MKQWGREAFGLGVWGLRGLGTWGHRGQEGQKGCIGQIVGAVEPDLPHDNRWC